MLNTILRYILIINVIFSLSSNLFAFSNDLFQKKYLSTIWTYSNLYPANNALDVVQGAEGFIWIASYEGLIRFDGKEFKLYNKYKFDNVDFIAAIDLFIDSKDRMWIGTNESGVALYENGKFLTLSSDDGISSDIVSSIHEDKSGNIWLGTSKGLDRLTYNNETESWEIKNIIKNKHIESLFALSNGEVAAIPNTGEVLIYSTNEFEDINLPKALEQFSFSSIIEDSKANIWLGTNSNKIVKINADKKIKIYDISDVSFISSIQEIDSFEGERRVVFTSDDGFGIFNEQSDNFVYFDESKGLINKSIEKAIVDSEGNLWLASKRKGLQKLTQSKFINYSKKTGLVDAIVNTIEELSDKSYLIGTNNGMSLIRGEEVIKNEFTEYFNGVRIRHIFRDSSDNIWIGTYSSLGLVKIKDGEFTNINTDKGLSYNKVRTSFEDSKGRIWIGTTSGLNLIEKPNADDLNIINEFENFPRQYVMCIMEDSDGNIIVGSDGNGIYILDENNNVKNITVDDGLAGNVIFRILRDSDDLIWITTNEGVSLLKDGEIHNFSMNDGLLSDANYQIIELDGEFWFTNSKGVFVVQREELLAQLSAKNKKLKVKNYDINSGLLGSATSTSWAIIDSNSNLWVPTINGASMLKKEEKLNEEDVKVLIEEIELDGKKYQADEIKVISPFVKRLKIKYSALSYKNPESLKFRYILEGFEKVWSDETSEREVIYTNLPAGAFTLKILATNVDGVWNSEPVIFKFYRKPFFYERRLFWALCILILISIIHFGNWLRIRAIKRQKEILEEEVENRTNELAKMAKKYQKKNFKLMDSIEYAESIQQGILTDLHLVEENFEDVSLIYMPRDMVSGDFYWYNKKGDDIYVAVGDCTGHGVPGAVLMAICHMLLDKHLSGFSKKGLDITLEKINSELKNILARNNADDSYRVNVNNGMDLSICKINKKENILEFCGARNSLFCFLNNGEFIKIKGTSKSIGYGFKRRKREKAFEKHTMSLDDIFAIYLTSDGFVDQLSDENKSFTTAKFEQILKEIVFEKTLKEQKEILQKELKNHMNDQNQTDDITVLGIKL